MVHKLPLGVVVLLGDRREIGVAGCRGLLGRDDRAGLVRYTKFSANLKVLLLTGYAFTAHARVPLRHGRHTRAVAPFEIAAL
jgi:hypothetical protein